MNNIEKYIKHFKTITKHKFYVMKFCFKCGKIKRGLLHDLSKYGITEFCSSAKYFQGTSSPIDAEKKEKGYSLAWQHHKGHNPHHWEYWCIYDQDKERNSLSFIRQAYHVEMMCDWMAMSQFENNTVPDWYINNQNKIVMNDDDKQFTEMLIDILF